MSITSDSKPSYKKMLLLEAAAAEAEPHDDHISRLTDDMIAVNILSRLTIKEAARTCILSSRWRFLWTSFSGTLDLDIHDYQPCENLYDLALLVVLGKIKSIDTYRQKRLSGFIDWVNHVLMDSLSAPLQQVRICMDDKSNPHLLDRWINFTLTQKKVQSLVLDLTNDAFQYITKSVYNFPANLRSKSLSVLRLCSVDVTGDVLENLLSDDSCPCLEQVSVSHSHSFSCLKISSLKLKHLELVNCFYLANLEISAPNLVTFIISSSHCFGNKLPFNGAPAPPRLAHPCLENFYGTWFVAKGCLSQSSSALAQLHTLELDLTHHLKLDELPDIPILSNLKHLELSVERFQIRDASFIPCASLFLKACPSLHQLTLKWFGEISVHCSPRRSHEVLERHPYQCLKVVKILGFFWCMADLEMVTYLLRNTTSLRKIIADPATQFFLHDRLLYKCNKSKEAKWSKTESREVVMKLRRRIPPEIEFEVPY